jgi:RNA polymerase sigma-70 factor (ECF subfamily)
MDPDSDLLAEFTAHRKMLFGIAYRMLGRVADAEDMVQAVWLRWQGQELAGIGSPRAWLVAATTRLCIDQLRAARREREEYYGVWLPEPLLEAAGDTEAPGAGLADSLSMAFMFLLETLGPVERAVFLLREVFDYDYADTAAIVGKSEANCRQIVSRARAQLKLRDQPPPPPDEQARQLVDQFLAASATGDVQRLLEMLAEDAVIYSDGGGRVRAAGRPVASADHVSRFFAGIWPRLPADTEWRLARINRRPGALMLSRGEVFGVCSFELAAGRIRQIYFVLNPEKLRHLANCGAPK